MINLSIGFGIYLTNYCNLNCAFCVHNCGPNRSNTHMSEERMNFILEYARSLYKNNYKIEYICITGGEPLTHPQFYYFLDNIIEKIKELGKVELYLMTNGTIRFKNTNKYLMTFNNINVGYDYMFHRKQCIDRGLKVYLDELTYISKSITLYYGGQHVFTNVNQNNKIHIRKIGRAGNFNKEYKIIEEKENSCHKNDKPLNKITISFSHNHIRFCSENSDYKKNNPTFTEYKKEYLKNPEKLLERAIIYRAFHEQRTCRKCKAIIVEEVK